MVQRVYRQLRTEFPHERVVLATGAAQREQIVAQLGVDVDIVCEPARRDTFPAIALSCTFLADTCAASPDDVVLVLPVDVYADQSYFSVVGKMRDVVRDDGASLVLMGITPSHPSQRFGYMVPVPTSTGAYTRIDRFVEKPDEESARSLIAKGALWNGGVFGFKLGYLMEVARSHLGDLSFQQFLDTYASAKKISFDYAVVEKAASIAMVRYAGMWRDLGTWETLVKEIGSDGIGAQQKFDTQETIVVNALDMPVVAIGTRNLVIAASYDGILVSDRNKSTGLKPLVDRFDEPPRFSQFAWGTSKVVDRVMDGSRFVQETRIVDMLPGQVRTLVSAEDETLTFICLNGSGTMEQDGEVTDIETGIPIFIEGGTSVGITSSSAVHALELVRRR